MKGHSRDDGSWEAAAGFNKHKGDLSWGVEGYAHENAFGQTDAGVRAKLKWTF